MLKERVCISSERGEVDPRREGDQGGDSGGGEDGGVAGAESFCDSRNPDGSSGDQMFESIVWFVL